MTVNPNPEWLLPLESNLTEELGPLRAALCTTYEPPDPDILIEDILPKWLGMTRELADSGPGRKTFLVELQQRLKSLRGRVTIFSSAGAITPHWLWRDLHVCQVGSGRRAVQHSKLWLLHRGPSAENKSSTLEIVVSSTNLTRASLQNQIQAGWRAVANLGKATSSRLSSWGVLPEFIEELGRQSGENGREAVRYWLDEVLPRTSCPDVTFVASVPGRHTGATLRRAKTSWGIAGLRQLNPIAPTRRITIISPSIGCFDANDIRQWADRAGSSVNRLTLAWIPKGHSWAGRGWSMPSCTGEALRENQVTVNEFPDPEDKAIEEFHEEWDRTRDRWVHGKLYWIQDAHRRRLLITSANWSQAAWGSPLPNGGLSIENFELGVVFDCAWTPLHDVFPLEDELATEEPKTRDPEPTVSWSEGSWDGKTIRIAIRFSRAKIRLLAYVDVMSRGKSLNKTVRWATKAANAVEGELAWPYARGIPTAARVRTAEKGADACDIVISDIRLRKTDGQEEYEGVDPQEAETLELRLLEERYHGPSADDPLLGPEKDPGPTVGKGGSDTNGDESDKNPLDPRGEDDLLGDAPTANYEVPSVVWAREKLAIVTNWAEKLAALPDDDDDGARGIIEDGRRLLELWRGQDNDKDGFKSLACRVAIGELAVRLNSCQ